MSIQQIRAALHNRIDEVDESFLRVVHAMIETYVKEQEDSALNEMLNELPVSVEWKELTEDELAERLDKSVAQYKRGEHITISELKKKSAKW